MYIKEILAIISLMILIGYLDFIQYKGTTMPGLLGISIAMLVITGFYNFYFRKVNNV